MFKRSKPTRKVRVKVERPAGSGKYKWLIGTVIGTKRMRRTNESPFASLFNMTPAQIWDEDKLLIRLSVGSEVERWDSEVFEVAS